MRLFRLELKRILKSRRTLILLAIALLLSVAMAYLPISFEGINRPNEDGTVTEFDGLAAIKYKQDLYKTSAGEVTPDRIKSALETYQSCVREYGPVEEEGFPLAVFIEKIVPFRHLLMGLPETFADPLTGIGADLMEMTLTEPIMKSAQNIYRMSCGMSKEKTKPHSRKLLKNIQNLIRHFIFILEFLKMHLIILSFIFCSLLFCVWQSQHLLSPENIKRAVTASCEPPNTGINN